MFFISLLKITEREPNIAPVPIAEDKKLNSFAPPPYIFFTITGNNTIKEIPKKETKEPNIQQKQAEQKLTPPTEEIAIKQAPKPVKKVKKYYI